MGFCFWPKHEYACPCVDHCPHAAVASLGSLIFHANQNMALHELRLRQLDAFREENNQQYHEIQELQDEVKRLKAELTEERRKKFRRSADNAKLDEQTKPDQLKQKKKVKRGAPVGHPGWFRRLTRKPDRVMVVAAPTTCPDCGHAVKLYPKRKPNRHHQDDIIDGRKQTVCFVHPKARCTNPKCRRWIQKSGSGELLRSKIGPNARAKVLYLRVRIGVSVDNVVDILKTFAGLSLSAGAIVGFENHAAERAQPLAHDVGKKLRACPVVHADESYWSVDGDRWYGWFHGSSTAMMTWRTSSWTPLEKVKCHAICWARDSTARWSPIATAAMSSMWPSIAKSAWRMFDAPPWNGRQSPRTIDRLSVFSSV